MSRNIEIKARVADLSTLKQRVCELTGSAPVVLLQEDTFFFSANGRLKLRQDPNRSAELIFYQRRNTGSPKPSSYLRTPVGEPELLKQILSKALGFRGTVRKTRLLFLIGQTRVHIDQVDDLGNYVELEVVLKNGQSDAEGTAIAEQLMSKLGIDAQNLIQKAYIDLLEMYSNQ